MALLERVATLIRANINDLVDKAEDPETMIKQVILDMENQLLQVKTQVAVSIADQHMLEKKLAESEENERQWMRRAELAVDKKDDALARAALERSMGYKTTAESFRQQVADQRTQVENLKAALVKLQEKLTDAQAKKDALIARHRCARALGKATEAGLGTGEDSSSAAFDRMSDKVRHTESSAQAMADLMADDVEDQFAALEKKQELDRLLEDLKSRRNAG
jgi:phage shock protein A